MNDQRKGIIIKFSQWTAVSSSHRGDIRDNETLLSLLELCDFNKLFHGTVPISKDEFTDWHRKNTTKICSNNPEISIGWAAKLINVYLKTRVYVAGDGRPDLEKFIHPPIDNLLWNRVKVKYPSLVKKTNFKSIKEITNYEDDYEPLIQVCRDIALKKKWLLIEVDSLWNPFQKKVWVNKQ